MCKERRKESCARRAAYLDHGVVLVDHVVCVPGVARALTEVVVDAVGWRLVVAGDGSST